MTALVIVESPTKATKIAGYLGDGFVVESSRGHVRDLPSRAENVPAKYKGEKWSRLGVNVEANFAPLYVVAAEKKSTITSLKKLLKEADELYLATDEDREGEAIAWHLLQELKPKVPVHRMVFHEITKPAIEAAVANPRELDTDLVDAQETRRILDRLYGYEVSPVLWKKVMPRLSAGRVQSVATRLVVDRERERIAFVPASYWGITATLDAGADAEPPAFDAALATVEGTKVAVGKNFNERGEVSGKVVVLDEAAATQLAERLREATFTVVDVATKPFTRKPVAPFRTTTLQQEAGRKLGFSAQRTMQVAQDLYERGFITYMRTDSITLSGAAISAARAAIQERYGAAYLPDKPRVYTSKVKNAQEAHEAIRPAGEKFAAPDQVPLSGDGARLYDLIWKRTIASQMENARGNTVTVKLEALECGFTASGSTITFPGFLKAYVESRDDAGDNKARIPQLEVGQELPASAVLPEGHETKPPARYTEPSLVAKLEELEIGRPSTYASIIRTIIGRDYVYKRGSALVPTFLAFAVTRLMEEHFSELVDYDFTAGLEETLDEVARGDAQRLEVLKSFYWGTDAREGLHSAVNDLGEIDAREVSTFWIGEKDSPDAIAARVGRYGAYLEDAEGNRANLPAEVVPGEITAEAARDLIARAKDGGRVVGDDPETGRQVVATVGRYGPYLFVREPEGSEEKPKSASLLPGMDVDTVTLDEALKALSLPREVGLSNGVVVTAQNGRFGPFISRGEENRSLESADQIFTVTLAEAEALLAEPPRPRGRRAPKPPLRELGVDPNTEKKMVIKDGRFGPYITDGEFNATVPRGDSVESITVARAVELLAEKRAAGPAKKPARKPAAKKTATRKTAAKKPAAKKTTTRKTAAKKSAAKKTTKASPPPESESS